MLVPQAAPAPAPRPPYQPMYPQSHNAGKPVAKVATMKKISPALFGIAILCFFMPFFSISCRGMGTAVTLTGMEMVTGKTVTGPSESSSDVYGTSSRRQRESEHFDPEPLAILIVVGCLAGLGLSFMSGGKTALFPAVTGCVCFVLMLFLKLRVESRLFQDAAASPREIEEAKQVVMVNYEIGFWCVLFLCAAAAALNFFIMSKSRPPRSPGGMPHY